MPSPAIVLRDAGSWQPPWRNLVLLHVSATADDDLVALWCAADDREVFLGTSGPVPGGPSAADDGGAPVLVTRHREPEDMSVLATIAGLELARPRAQVLSDGSVLVVGDVDLAPGGGPARNAVVVAPNGTILRSGSFGAGAHLIQVSSAGPAWVGYGDRATPGAPGVSLFTEALMPAVASPTTDPGAVSALNVVGEVGWGIDHGSSELVRMERGQLRRWVTGLGAATDLLVAGETVAIIGGEGDPDRIVVGWLGTAAFEPFLEARLVLPDGAPLPADAVLVGRGSVLHCIAGDRRYRFDLAEG